MVPLMERFVRGQRQLTTLLLSDTVSERIVTSSWTLVPTTLLDESSVGNAERQKEEARLTDSTQTADRIVGGWTVLYNTASRPPGTLTIGEYAYDANGGARDIHLLSPKPKHSTSLSCWHYNMLIANMLLGKRVGFCQTLRV
jgi:hypothetical protein